MTTTNENPPQSAKKPLGLTDTVPGKQVFMVFAICGVVIWALLSRYEKPELPAELTQEQKNERFRREVDVHLAKMKAEREFKGDPVRPQAGNWLEIIGKRNDYSNDQGNLLLVNSSPLKFEIHATEAAAQLPQYKAESVNRAALYGVYRTFIHTHEPSVDLRAGLREIEGNNPPVMAFNLGYRVQIKATRAEALAAIQTLLPRVKGFEDLVTTELAGGIKWEGVWTKDFESIYMKAPLQRQLLDALGAQTRYDS